MTMNAGSIDELIARCKKDLEERGFMVPLPSVMGPTSEMWVPVGISNRHVHLTEDDFKTLFGSSHAKQGLTKLRDLSQPRQFAACEAVSLIGPKGSIPSVRVLGPFRCRTQVEITRSDTFSLGINPPVRESGDLDGAAPVTLVGPAGAVHVPEGAIIALRHIHITPEDAAVWGLRDKCVVQVEIGGARGMALRNVVVRVRDDFRLEMHVDTDEANAALLKSGDLVRAIIS
jgi:propanediol utilization protein